MKLNIIVLVTNICVHIFDLQVHKVVTFFRGCYHTYDVRT